MYLSIIKDKSRISSHSFTYGLKVFLGVITNELRRSNEHSQNIFRNEAYSGWVRNVQKHTVDIFCPDCTQCLSDDFKVSQLIHGGELVIVTNAALTDNDDKMLSMIVEMNQKNIAGLVIMSDSITYADRILQ